MTLQVIRLFGYDGVTESINLFINLNYKIMVTNEMICKMMDIILRGLAENLWLTYEDFKEMDLNGHPVYTWYDRWCNTNLSKFWCILDDSNREKFVAYLVKKGKFSSLN